MKSLETIQKTFKVFQSIAKAAQILCIVGASIGAVVCLCAITWQNGGHVFDIFGQPLEPFFGGDLLTAYAKFLSMTFTLTAGAILLGFAHSYLKSEQADGTPFTEKGAAKLLKLGIRCIYIPIIAASAAEALAIWIGAENAIDSGNFSGTVIGIVLILTSLVIRYGTELAGANQPITLTEQKTAE